MIYFLVFYKCIPASEPKASEAGGRCKRPEQQYKRMVSSLRLQIISDIHLEFYQLGISFEKFIKPSAPILVLCGDISPVGTLALVEHLKRFLEWCSARFETVLYVPGNHEFYSSNGKKENNTMDQVILKIQTIIKPLKNVHLLYNKMICQAGMCFCGTTMWTKIDPQQCHEIQMRMNDYCEINLKDSKHKKGFRHLNTADVSWLHKNSETFLKKCITLAKKKNMPLVVITHHKPTCTRDCSDLSSAYESNMSHLMGPPVVAWLHGHTHRHNDQRVDGTRVYSNAYGYPGEPGVNHHPNATIYLKY